GNAGDAGAEIAQVTIRVVEAFRHRRRSAEDSSRFERRPKMSSPNFGADRVPLTFTGISVAPPFLKNGETGRSSNESHGRATICDSDALVRTFPRNSNCWPSKE